MSLCLLSLNLRHAASGGDVAFAAAMSGAKGLDDTSSGK